jgi:hypothetical protein
LAEELRTLGAEVDTQFVYRPDHTNIETALKAVIADQEMICGYKLVLLSTRSVELADGWGRYVEVFVTLGPSPTE